jgi:hypothetical protein
MIGLFKAKACNSNVAGFFVSILKLPPEHFIQFLFFKFKIGRFAIRRAVGYAAVKQCFH